MGFEDENPKMIAAATDARHRRAGMALCRFACALVGLLQAVIIIHRPFRLLAEPYTAAA